MAKKFKKLKKHLSGIIFSQNGMRLTKKATKKFYSRIPFIVEPNKKFQKSSKKIQKIKKPLSGIFFSQNGMR